LAFVFLIVISDDLSLRYLWALWFVEAGFLLATFQLIGAHAALIAPDPPAMPQRHEWERSLSLFTIVMLALVCSCGLLLLAMATTWIPATMLHRRGWRIVYAPDYVTQPSEATFSLSTLFGLMTCVAVLSGIASALVRLGGIAGAWPLVALALLVGFGLSPIAWFLPRPVNWWAGGIAIVGLMGTVAWLNLGPREMGSLLVSGTNLAVGHGVAIAVQRAGFRLLRLPEEMRRRSEPNVES
jgi:hypothetical protein